MVKCIFEENLNIYRYLSFYLIFKGKCSVRGGCPLWKICEFCVNNYANDFAVSVDFYHRILWV